MDKRTKAREIAMQALFQLDVQGEEVFDCLDSFIRENCEDDLVYEMAKSWAHNTWKDRAHCDEIIEKAAPRWRISRIELLERNILRLGCYQLSSCKDIPEKVVMNEAIEIAKRYGSSRSPAFVNGVMDAMCRILNEAPSETIEKIEISEVPEVSDVPEAAEVPEVSEVPEAAEVPGVSEVTEVAEASDVPDVSDVPEVDNTQEELTG